MRALRPELRRFVDLSDWRKLAQGFHARCRTSSFGEGARFVAALSEIGDEVGHYPRVSLGTDYVDLKLTSDDAIYGEDDGTEHVVEWVTQQDVDLARRITDLAAEHGLAADPTSVSVLELGLEASDTSSVARVWAALLTGNPDDQGRGTPGDEIRDGLGRIPNLWFDDLNPNADKDTGQASRQRFHIEVYITPEVAQQRLGAVVAAGGTIVDDSESPSLTVIADQDGNRGVLCVAQPASGNTE